MVMTERVRTQMQVSKMKFLKNQKVTILDKVCYSAIKQSLNTESLLFQIERSQLRWFGYISRMPQEQPPANFKSEWEDASWMTTDKMV